MIEKLKSKMSASNHHIVQPCGCTIVCNHAIILANTCGKSSGLLTLLLLFCATSTLLLCLSAPVCLIVVDLPVGVDLMGALTA